jgi:hypothetical protein
LVQNTQAAATNTTGSIQLLGGLGLTGNLYTGNHVITGPVGNGITFVDGTTQVTSPGMTGFIC